MSGLIAGSIIPDFEYLLRMQIDSGIGHTLLGVFIYALPSGILALYLFYNLLVNDLISNLPEYFRSRLWFMTQIDWNTYFKKHYPVVGISVIIGTLSHLFLDAFTHPDGFFINTFPVLSNYYTLICHKMALWNILQFSLTFLGGFIILLYITRLSPQQIHTQHNIFPYWSAIIVITICLTLLRISTGDFGRSEKYTIIVSATGAVLYAVFLTSVFLRVKKSLRQKA